MEKGRINSLIRCFLYLLIFWLPYSPAVVETSIIFSLILWFIKRAQGVRSLGIRAFRLPDTSLNGLIFLFLIVGFLSSLGSLTVSESLRNYITKTLEWFVIYFLVVECFVEKKHIRIALIVFVVTAVSTSLDGIWQFYFSHKDIFLSRIIIPGDPPTAGFKTPNGLGAYLTIVTPYMICLIFGDNVFDSKRTRMLMASLTGIVMWCLILSQSRGAWMGVFLTTFLVLVFRQNMVVKILQTKRCYSEIIAFLFVFTPVLILSLLLTNDIYFQSLIGDASTANWRIWIWKDSLRMIIERPFFGHGVNTFMSIFQYYNQSASFDPTFAHNCLLQLAAEMGVLGLLFFLMILYVMFKDMLMAISNMHDRHKPLFSASLGLLAGVLAFCIHSLFDNHFYSLQLSTYFWYMIGVLISIQRLSSCEQKQ